LTTRPLNDTELFPTALFLLRIAKNHLPTDEQVRNAVVHEELLLINHKFNQQNAATLSSTLDTAVMHTFKAAAMLYNEAKSPWISLSLSCL
jgi:hypothetical protein